MKLPIVGSSAPSTSYTHARLDGPAGKHLFLDGNGKVTAGNGTLTNPSPNAFSLVNIKDCPQATPTCKKVCYVENLRAAQPDLAEMYRHNSYTIREILHGCGPSTAQAWAQLMAWWITDNAAGGFRWHVSGDVFSLDYALWIADVCRQSPQVQHWIYTRSFSFLAPLVAVSAIRGGPLALNLSCDADNFERATDAADAYGIGGQRLRLCYLTVDGRLPRGRLGAGDVIFPDYALRPRQFASLAESPWWATLTKDERGLVCPVDAHGKAEDRRCGPCSRCLT